MNGKVTLLEYPFAFDLAVASGPLAFSGSTITAAKGRVAEIDARVDCDGEPSHDAHITSTKFEDKYLGKGIRIAINVSAPSATPKSRYSIAGTLFVEPE